MYKRQSYEALSGLLLESNLSLPFLVPEGVHISPSVYDAPWLLYLQKLVLQGRLEYHDGHLARFYRFTFILDRWDDLDGYLKSIMTAFKSSEEIAIANKVSLVCSNDIKKPVAYLILSCVRFKWRFFDKSSWRC